MSKTQWAMGATLSECGTYRYALWRSILGSLIPTLGRVCFVMLNPSVADALQDDATIRVLKGYTERWGFGEMVVVNLFAYRATHPRDLLIHANTGGDVVGPQNDEHILDAARYANLIVCAWGADGDLMGRDRAVAELLARANPSMRLHALSLTKGGAPVHPLRQPRDRRPMIWTAPTPEARRGAGEG